MIDLHINGLDELRAKFSKAPQVVRAEMERTMQQTLLTIQGSVPAYPPPPAGSRYVRTGTLGKSMGSSESGGSLGRADVFEVRALGSAFQGRFGSRLSYAPDVIGTQQKPFFAAYWWNIVTVAKAARPNVNRLWKGIADRIAAALD